MALRNKLSNLNLLKSKQYYLYLFFILVLTIVGGGILSSSVKATGAWVPNVPTNITVTQGDREALVSWNAPADGDCPTIEYYVVIYKGWWFEHVAESQMLTATSWHVDELTPNTSYTAEVFSYGETCDDYAEASVNFTTNANNSASDPARPSSNKKKIARRVRDFTAVSNRSDNSVTLTWKKPNLGNASRRCQPETNIQYDYDIVKLLSDGTYEYFGVDANTQPTRGTTSNQNTVTVKVTGLDRGYDYEASVAV